MTEPEEIIESKLVALLAASGAGIDVLGALAPAPSHTEKKSPDTYISVFVDQSSQDMDWEGPGVPCTYSARVGVHVSNADDKTGALFRDACRAVRGALAALTGDDCKTLGDDGFHCDSFVLGETQTALESFADSFGMAKTYNATVKGRFTPQTETTEKED
jgi:hypothetical protein